MEHGPYDTEEGIARYLTDLNGLSRLAEDRHEAGYKRKEQLHEFIVLGRFDLDTCGNFSRAIIRREDHRDKNDDWLERSLPPVLSKEQLFTVLNGIRISSFGYRLPSPQAVCSECGEGWSISNAHDAVVERTLPFQFHHLLCSDLAAEREALKTYRELADKAGLQKALITAIPNEYGPGREPGEGGGWWNAPWCLLRTYKGNIKLGLRKRVWFIGWQDIVQRGVAEVEESVADFQKRYDARQRIHEELSAKTLFPNEDVTRGDTYIHAWGQDKAVEYLKKLKETLELYGKENKEEDRPR